MCCDWPSLLDRDQEESLCSAAASICEMVWWQSITWMRAACLWWTPAFQSYDEKNSVELGKGQKRENMLCLLWHDRPKLPWFHLYVILLPFIIPYLITSFSLSSYPPALSSSFLPVALLPLCPMISFSRSSSFIDSWQNTQKYKITPFAQPPVKWMTVSARQHRASVKLIIHTKVASHKG